MFYFNKANHADRFYVVYDICSSSVGVGIVAVHDHKEEILWSKRTSFGFTISDDYNHYVRTMYATLFDVGMKMVSEGMKVATERFPHFSPRIMSVFCFLSSPWFIGAVSTDEYKKEKKFLITDDLLETLTQKAFEKTLQKSEVVSWGEVMGTSELLESLRTEINISGYRVFSYNKRDANELTVSLYFGIVSKKVHGYIEDVLRRVLPNHDITFLSTTHALSKLSRFIVHDNRVIFVEVTGEVTGVSFLEHGVLTATQTFPQGINHVLHACAPKAIKLEEAMSAFEIIRKKMEKDKASIPSGIEKALATWKSSLVSTVFALAQGVVPPSKIVLVGDESWSRFYLQYIEDAWEVPMSNMTYEHSCIIPFKEEASHSKYVGVSKDDRLSIFIHSLPPCVQGDGVCYTNS